MLVRLIWFLYVIVVCANSQCPEGINNNGTCTDTKNSSQTQEMSTHTPQPPTIPKSLNMLSEEDDEAKGRAIIFPGNGSDNNAKDLSDVSLDDDDDEDMTTKSSTSKSVNASHFGVCEKGGLTYENGEKLEVGCDSICTCMNGKMDCMDRCVKPFLRKGTKLKDPLCMEKDSDDQCCSVLVCATDTETEPLEICSFGNKTYNRGDIFNKNCSEVCTCEIAGKISCKQRCPPVNKTSDRCVELPDPDDSCCKKLLCDVSLDDHEDEKDDEMAKIKIVSVKVLNESTLLLKFDQSIDKASHYIETSDDKTDWQTYSLSPGGYLHVQKVPKYLKLDNSDRIVTVQNSSTSLDAGVENGGCKYKDKHFDLGQEYNDGCQSLCVCRETGMKCLKLECPTYFGVDVMDPNCVEWETVPPNFTPTPPNCCPDKLRCKSNGSCTYEGQNYQNWQQLPINITGCDKRCYCENGNVECQNTCPPVTALPPPTLPCPPQRASVGYLPGEDCCKYWICNAEGKNSTNSTDVPLLGHNEQTTKVPSKVLGPLSIYENKQPQNGQNYNNPLVPYQPPAILPEENPFVHKNSKKPKLPSKMKPSKDGLFVTPPPHQNPNIVNQPQQTPTNHNNDNNANEILQFIHQHPEIANYPSGSVVEIHPNKPQTPQYINHNAVIPRPQVPYYEDIPPGLTLEQILQEIHKAHTPVLHPHQQYQGQIQINGVLPNRTFPAVGGVGSLYPGQVPDYQPQQEITVSVLEAVDSHTVRLAFIVPPFLVGLHGRVEVRYTNNADLDLSNWELQVFAPPNDLIATSQLEFDLLGLKADTEYKIRITVTLRDTHQTTTSRVYSIKTPKAPISQPSMIPIDPELAITDINATWVTVVWRKFTDYELQFIDGVQLRYKEIDGKVYDATPLIHRSVTSYTLENLKPNTKYEIGIFFIPFPGQQTELHAELMLHYTTANKVDTYGFNVTLEISHIKSTSVEIIWSGVPYPEDKYVNIYRAIYQSESGKEDHSTFKIAKRDSPTKTIIMDLKPGTRYRLWLEVYLTNGKIKTSNVQDFITKPRTAPALGASSQQDKLSSGENRDHHGDYYGPLVIVAILASIAILSTLILLLILVRRHNQNKAAITPPTTRVSQSAYDNPTYKVEIQQETMGL